MTAQTADDRSAYYWLQAERARHAAKQAQHENARLSLLEVAKGWVRLAESVKPRG